jgi:RNA-binding protein YlmH
VNTEIHQVIGVEKPLRLSDYAGGIFELIPSRKGMKKAIDKGWVTINGKRASTGDFISEGDLIELSIRFSLKPFIDWITQQQAPC